MSGYRQIVNIDLKEGIPSLDFESAHAGIYLIAWYEDVPLAHKRIEPSSLPMSKSAVAELLLPHAKQTLSSYQANCEVDHLDASSEEQLLVILNRFGRDKEQLIAPVNRAISAPVSVVIPTMNRPDLLLRCLDSLMVLSCQPLEIIVVDNDPATASATVEVVEQFHNVKYVAQPRPGASAARNLGAQMCSGDIIVFVDDDEQVDSKWLSRIIEGFADPNVGATTGLVLPGKIETESQDFFETRFSFVRGYKPRLFDQDFFEAGKLKGVPVWEIGGSGNMAVRRELFLTLGGFDERLGGGHAGCSEDTEFFYRLLKFDWKIVYQPLAICYHSHRTDPGNLKWQIFSYMRGHVVALLVQFYKYRDLSNLSRLFFIIPIVYLKYIFRSLLLDPHFSLWVLRLEILGCLSGARYFFRHRKFWLEKQQQPLVGPEYVTCDQDALALVGVEI